VRDKARIEASIIWAGSKIGSAAVVRDSIIGSNVWIGDDAVIEGAVIANGARVRRGAKLPRGARLEPEEVAG
jgi:NDP-sugar pyrophosphorylase family protein